jgi:hypothetical protein
LAAGSDDGKRGGPSRRGNSGNWGKVGISRFLHGHSIHHTENRFNPPYHKKPGWEIAATVLAIEYYEVFKNLGAVFCSAKNCAFRGFRPNTWPMALRQDRWPPQWPGLHKWLGPSRSKSAGFATPCAAGGAAGVSRESRCACIQSRVFPHSGFTIVRIVYGSNREVLHTQNPILKPGITPA